MTLYLYQTNGQKLIETVEASHVGSSWIKLLDGGTLIPPPGVEVSSLPDLSEQLLQQQMLNSPDNNTRLMQLEELMMSLIYGGKNG